jgi:dihydrofolate reductase
MIKMRKLVIFMHVTLDGFVAGPDGEMDWIRIDEEIFDYARQRTNESDTALYGRVTYQLMESYWPTAGDQPGASKHDIGHSAWYNKVAKVIVSRSMKGQTLKNTTIISEGLAGQILELKQRQGKDIVIFGSPGAAHSLMRENLIDEFWLLVNPVLLGQGIPLFKDIDGVVKLRLIKSIPFASGVVCMHYGLL